MNGTAIDFVTNAPCAGSAPGRWNHGTPGEPLIQIHHYDEHTVILRQSKTVDYEAPFIFLLFGEERALLLDTGATQDPGSFPIRATVDGLVDRWLAAHPREGYELVVAHTHGHHDHVAGDGQFAGRPATTVVGTDAGSVRAFFGFGDGWPERPVTFGLGGRVLDVLGSPGHQDAAITVHDRWTGILFTGDTVLPGRLYAFDPDAYAATLERMVAFAAERQVTRVIGCHVEMAAPAGRDYPIGARFQPDERSPWMTPDQLTAVRDAVAAVGGRPGVHRFDDFVLLNSPTEHDFRLLLARGNRNLERADGLYRGTR